MNGETDRLSEIKAKIAEVTALKAAHEETGTGISWRRWVDTEHSVMGEVWRDYLPWLIDQVEVSQSTKRPNNADPTPFEIISHFLGSEVGVVLNGEYVKGLVAALSNAGFVIEREWQPIETLPTDETVELKGTTWAESPGGIIPNGWRSTEAQP